MFIVQFLFEHPFVVPIFLVIFPSLLWKESWFVTYSAVLASFFLIVWGIELYQTSRPEYVDHAAGAAFGTALFVVLTFTYALGVILRTALYALLKFMKSSRANET